MSMTRDLRTISGLKTVIYLRKSRTDLEAERYGQGDTLARHRAWLMDYAQKSKLIIGAIYEEIASGETISARPQMQRLLREVSAGQWQAVLVTEIPRLARGDTSDQGLVSKAFQYSNTLIITPSKIYDPQSISDTEYLEFGLFLSRREYQMINQRLKAGRQAAVREGKYIGSVPPYGYEIVKLSHEKGNTLRPIFKESTVVQRIFHDFLSGHTQNEIASQLNAENIPTMHEKHWTPAGIHAILRNPHYAGFTIFGLRPVQKRMQTGILQFSRPQNHDVTLYQGRHTGLVSIEDFRRTQAILQTHRIPPVPHPSPAQNPLAGLIVCSICGKKMQRRPFRKTGRAFLICPTPHCPTVSHDFSEIERLIFSELSQFFKHFIIKPPLLSHFSTLIEKQRSKLSQIITEQKELEKQKQNLFQLVERGVYTDAQFLERQQALQYESHQLHINLTKSQEQLTQFEQHFNSLKNTPSTHSILSVYQNTPSQRSKLLHALLYSVTYCKTVSIRARASTDLTLTLHPKFSSD